MTVRHSLVTSTWLTRTPVGTFGQLLSLPLLRTLGLGGLCRTSIPLQLQSRKIPLPVLPPCPHLHLTALQGVPEGSVLPILLEHRAVSVLSAAALSHWPGTIPITFERKSPHFLRATLSPFRSSPVSSEVQCPKFFYQPPRNLKH